MYLAPDVFILPDDGERSFILYAPLLGIAAQVNAALAAVIEGLKAAPQGEAEVSDDALRGQLSALGLLSPRPYPDLAPRSALAEYQPCSVSLFLTTACNLGCTYCYASANEAPEAMGWPMAKRALDLVFDNALAERAARGAEHTVSVMLHGGGEASLEWELLTQIVEYTRERARAAGLRSHMTIGTNGLMPAARAEYIAQNFDGATVSLDGTADIHDRFRPTVGGKPSHSLVLRTLGIFDALGLDYGLRMTVTPDWTERLPEAVEDICTKIRVHTIQAEPVFPVGRAERNQLSSPNARLFIDAFRRAAKVAARHGRRLTYSGARVGQPRDSFCRASGQSFAVTPRGDVSSCYEVADRADSRNEAFFWGHYDEKRGAFELDQTRRKEQEQLTVHGKADCAHCFCKWTCAGDCSAKLASLGDARATRLNPRCEVNRALTRDMLVRAIRSGESLGATERSETHATEG